MESIGGSYQIEIEILEGERRDEKRKDESLRTGRVMCCEEKIEALIVRVRSRSEGSPERAIADWQDVGASPDA